MVRTDQWFSCKRKVNLLVDGRIRRQGRGTVVSRPQMVQPLSSRSYTGAALSPGRVPTRTASPSNASARCTAAAG